MADIKTKLWYAGGPTWRPGRKYSPSRQLSILDRMFGEANPEGPLMLPNRLPLLVGPYLAEEEAAPMIKVVSSAGFDGNGLDSVEGFFPNAFKKILMLGRAAMEEKISKHSSVDGRTFQSQTAGSSLIDLVMLEAIFGDPEDGVPAGWPGEFWDTIFESLGDELGAIEESLPGDHPFDLEERPMEKLVVDINNRFSEILR